MRHHYLDLGAFSADPAVIAAELSGGRSHVVVAASSPGRVTNSRRLEVHGPAGTADATKGSVLRQGVPGGEAQIVAESILVRIVKVLSRNLQSGDLKVRSVPGNAGILDRLLACILLEANIHVKASSRVVGNRGIQLTHEGMTEQIIVSCISSDGIRSAGLERKADGIGTKLVGNHGDIFERHWVGLRGTIGTNGLGDLTFNGVIGQETLLIFEEGKVVGDVCNKELINSAANVDEVLSGVFLVDELLPRYVQHFNSKTTTVGVFVARTCEANTITETNPSIVALARIGKETIASTLRNIWINDEFGASAAGGLSMCITKDFARKLRLNLLRNQTRKQVDEILLALRGIFFSNFKVASMAANKKPQKQEPCNNELPRPHFNAFLKSIPN
eukprot:Colp12_sorted_trinity150504_noHs@23869